MPEKDLIQGEMAVLSLAEIQNNKLIKLFDYWNSLRNGRLMPSRSDINPVDLAFMLGWILLIEIYPDPTGQEPFLFRYRLSGAELDKVSRCSLQGHWANELNDSFQRYATIHAFKEAAETAAPNFYRVSLKQRGEKYLTYERITLPLSVVDPNKPGMLLVGIQGVMETASRQYYVDLPAMQDLGEGSASSPKT